MAKIIRLTPELIEGIREDFNKTLESLRLSDGKISYNKSLTAEKQEAFLFFTEVAWIKMWELIRHYDKEVAWHGFARRGDDETKNEYFIEDIMTYPQKVSGATVETDPEEYQKWIMTQDRGRIRFQGHSHVNMSTSPSGTDTGYYKEILDQLGRDMFYIFAIFNKRGEKTIMIYDMKKNLLFENADIKVALMDGDMGLAKFLNESKTMVKDRVFTYQQPKPAVPAVKTEEKKEEKKPEPAKESKEEDAPPKFMTTVIKRKGKRRATAVSAPYNASFADYDDDDDPYGPFGWRDSWR